MKNWLDVLGIMGPRERRICELVVLGARPVDIAKDLRMAPRTVKAHLNRLYLRFGIVDGVKGVKLAVLLFRSKRRTEAKRKARAA